MQRRHIKLVHAPPRVDDRDDILERDYGRKSHTAQDPVPEPALDLALDRGQKL